MNILILIIIYQRDILLKNRLNSFDADVKWYFRPIKSAGISFKYLMPFQSIWIWLFILLLKYIVSILYECIWKDISYMIKIWTATVLKVIPMHWTWTWMPIIWFTNRAVVIHFMTGFGSWDLCSTHTHCSIARWPTILIAVVVHIKYFVRRK